MYINDILPSSPTINIQYIISLTLRHRCTGFCRTSYPPSSHQFPIYDDPIHPIQSHLSHQYVTRAQKEREEVIAK